MKFFNLTKILVIALLAFAPLFGESMRHIPADRVLTNKELLGYVDYSNPDIMPVKSTIAEGDTQQALHLLAGYLREKAGFRYYFDWHNFDARFQDYRNKYPGMEQEHARLAREQMSEFAANTHWKLPFTNLRGDSVTAYELRHLARQQKSDDIAFMYFYSGGDTTYLNYFVRQVADLNHAFTAGEYDNAGNGIYERYRAGRRIHNWLRAYNLLLASDDFTWEDQLLLVRTFLHHAAQLAERTEEFSYGNHHTKGLVALFQIATLFPEFSDSRSWQQQAIDGLVKHLTREVNADGFQFERSVHYHIGDIDNYFRVYQLAKINHVELPEAFRKRMYLMFDALVKIAQPNRKDPVLQDDTDSPYQEYNDISNIMTIGSLLFEDPVFKYFANDEISADIYWYFPPDQTAQYHAMQGKKPEVGSIALKETGYYVMRNGWHRNNEQMVITAGLSKQKPDHQHGDMLGITAYANGHEILPNYQVHYNIPGYKYWKNSWVKNVAIVDSIPLGRGWKPNSGGSGFGKWTDLPHPKVILWEDTPTFDYFSGTHDSYDAEHVKYHREVLFIKDGFWIVRDHLIGEEPHTLQQIWQGHYSVEIPGKTVRSSFSDGSGLSITQLGDTAAAIRHGGMDGKGNVMFVGSKSREMTFTTLLFPYLSYLDIPNDQTPAGKVTIGNWLLYPNPHKTDLATGDMQTDAGFIITKDSENTILFDANNITVSDHSLHLQTPLTFALNTKKNSWNMSVLGVNQVTFQPQSDFEKIVINGDMYGKSKPATVKPGDKILIIWEKE